MSKASIHDVQQALDLLAPDEWDRIFGVVEYFDTQLQNMPEPITSYDVLQETVEDLLTGTRSWPNDEISIHTCLCNIVRSKVSNLQDKTGRTGVFYVPEEAVEWETGQDAAKTIEDQTINEVSLMKGNPIPTACRQAVLRTVETDNTVQRLVVYWLDHLHEDVEVEMLAAAVGADADDPAFRDQCRQAEEALRTCLHDWKHEEVLHQMLECVENDPELARILQYLWDHQEQARPREVAAGMNLPATAVYNANKRIARNECLQQIRERLRGSASGP